MLLFLDRLTAIIELASPVALPPIALNLALPCLATWLHCRTLAKTLSRLRHSRTIPASFPAATVREETDISRLPTVPVRWESGQN